jgi:Domain of unknown function (DUF4397)
MQPSRFNFRALAASIFIALLAGCGSGGDDSSSLRLLNATADVGSLDFYTKSGTDDDVQRGSNVAVDGVSGYASVDSGSYTLKVMLAGNSASLTNPTLSLTSDYHYTAVAYGRSGAVKVAVLTEEEDEPASGKAEVRILNAASDVGAVDMYITDSSTALGNATANATSIAAGSTSGFSTFATGTYRLRITAAGDTTDVRLDVPSITLTDRERVTVILQPTTGGVLANALMLIQQGSLTVSKNTNARVRAVASVSGNGVVTAQVASTSLTPTSLTSPAVGAYVLVPAGSQTLLAQVNGATVSSASTSFTAGADYTVMLYGNTTSSQMSLLSDNNRLPADTGKAKLRLVHGAEGYNALSLSLDNVSVADQVGYGVASTAAQVAPNSGNALVEVTSSLSNTPLYTTTKSSGSTGVTIDTLGVYSVFMLSGNATPRGVLRKER